MRAYLYNIVVCVHTVFVRKYVHIPKCSSMRVYLREQFRFEYHYIPSFRCEYDQTQDSDLSIVVYQSFIREYDHIHDLDLSINVYQVVDEVPLYTFLPFLNNPNGHTRKKNTNFQ